MIKISDFCCACHQSLSPTPHSDGRQLPMCSPTRGLHGRKLASLPEPCHWPCEWAWRRLLLRFTLGVTAASVNTLIATSQGPWARDPSERSQTPGPQTQWDIGCWWCFSTTVLSKKFLKRLMEEGLWEWGGWEKPLWGHCVWGEDWRIRRARCTEHQEQHCRPRKQLVQRLFGRKGLGLFWVVTGGLSLYFPCLYFPTQPWKVGIIIPLLGETEAESHLSPS